MPGCPSCGKDFPEGAGFCDYCGADLRGPGPGVSASSPAASPSSASSMGAWPAAAQSVGAPTMTYWTCTRCSVENDVGALFCRACGAARAERAAGGDVAPPPSGVPRWTCATCGQANEPAARFCPYCGMPGAGGRVSSRPAAATGASAAAGPCVAAAAPAAAREDPAAAGSASPPGQDRPPTGGAPTQPAGEEASAGRRRSRWLLVAAALLALAAVGGAAAFVINYRFKSPVNIVSLVTLAPESPNTLAPGQRVNIAFKYTTNEAGGMRIFARPFTAGALTPGYSANPSPVYPVGSGMARGFFTILTAPATVDHVRIRMEDADQTRVLFETKIPVSYQFLQPIM